MQHAFSTESASRQPDQETPGNEALHAIVPFRVIAAGEPTHALTQDAIATSLQRFESAPPEGFDYWYRLELLRHLKDLAIPAIIWLGLFILVIRGMVHTAKR